MRKKENKTQYKEKAMHDMAQLLLSKAKMLKYHCSQCGSPLFEKEEKVLCPVCGEVRLLKEGETKEDSKKTKDKIHDRKVETSDSPPHYSETVNIKENELLSRLKEEQDLRNINEILDALVKLKKLKS